MNFKHFCFIFLHQWPIFGKFFLAYENFLSFLCKYLSSIYLRKLWYSSESYLISTSIQIWHFPTSYVKSLSKIHNKGYNSGKRPFRLQYPIWYYLVSNENNDENFLICKFQNDTCLHPSEEMTDKHIKICIFIVDCYIKELDLQF